MTARDGAILLITIYGPLKLEVNFLVAGPYIRGDQYQTLVPATIGVALSGLYKCDRRSIVLAWLDHMISNMVWYLVCISWKYPATPLAFPPSSGSGKIRSRGMIGSRPKKTLYGANPIAECTAEL